MTARHLTEVAKRQEQGTSDQAIQVVSTDFRSEHRPDRARALAHLLFDSTSTTPRHEPETERS